MELTKTKYKQTEYGLIPGDWDIKYVDEVLRISTGSKNTQDKISDGKYPFYVRSQTIERINSYSYDCEAVLTVGDGVGTGKVFHYVNHKFELHQRVYIMNEFSSSIDGYYFYLFFSKYFYDRVMQMTAKSSVDSVRRDMIAGMKIPLPPLPEQKAIAEVLSDVDSLIQAIEQKLAKKRVIKQGAMQKLLTPPSRTSGQGKEDWEVKKLGEIATMSSGGTPSSKVAEYYDGNIIWVSISDITKAGKYISESARMITEKGLLNSSARIFPKNIVLLAMYASIGKCCITTEEVTTSQAILGIEVNHELLNEYLYYYLLDSKDKLANQGQQGTQSNLNKGMVENIDIPLPSIEEQNQIATILSDMEKEIELIEAQLAKYQVLKQGLMQELLTGKIRLTV